MNELLERLLSQKQRVLLAQFLRFGTVGVLGFVIDTATVYATKGTIGLYGAGAAGYAVAATVNWAVNRAWTFRGHGDGTLLRQWALYLFANLGGLVLNRGAFFLLVSVSTLCADAPVIAVAAGAVCGMFANFHLSRAVFTARRRIGNA